MIVNENKSVPFLKSLTACIEKMNADGYSDDFKALSGGLQSLRTQKIYRPEEVSIVNFYRFEGVSNPDDMSILYVIETNDGLKGTLIDAYGTYSDPDVAQFIPKVQNIHKKIHGHEVEAEV